MNTGLLTRAVALALLSSTGLAACGGGGGMVRPAPMAPPPPPPPPPIPPPPTSGPCPMPVTADCVVTQGGTMLDGRDSTHGLVVQLPDDGELQLGGNSPPYDAAARQGTYTFASGTRVESGSLKIVNGAAPNMLVSDVETGSDGRVLVHGRLVGDVRNMGTLFAYGHIRGDVDNAGMVYLADTIEGDVVNRGTFHAAYGYYDERMAILGNFSQAASGTLVSALVKPLHVSGHADLAGTLQLSQYADAFGYGPLPGADTYAVLHADGGVSGTFDRWISPGLFIEGNIRYGSNDVWFDLARISVQATMAGRGIGGVTLASAANLDRALGFADGHAQLPRTPLGADQQRFLQSAGRLLWLSDPAQAARSLDSIAGHGHLHLVQAQYALAGQGAIGIARHAMQLRPGSAGAWSGTLAYGGIGAGIEGYDRWLGPRLLVGGGISEGSQAIGFAQSGGHASGQDRQASLYLHYRADRWQATAVGTAGRSQRLLQRRIDLDDGRRHLASAQRSLSLAGVYGEIARQLPLAGGDLQAFVALDYAMQHSARFGEAGDTGFELVADNALLRQLSASWGLRYARQWRWGAGWLGLQAEWQALHPLAREGAMRAAFAGVPQATFDLAAAEDTTAAQVARLGLEGGIGDRWRWSLQGTRGSDHRLDHAWQLRFARDL